MLEEYGNVNKIVFDDGPDSIDRLISQIFFQAKNMNWKKNKTCMATFSSQNHVNKCTKNNFFCVCYFKYLVVRKRKVLASIMKCIVESPNQFIDDAINHVHSLIQDCFVSNE